MNKNFTLIWLGKVISQLGDKFYAIALAWWILQKTNSPAIMGFFLLVSVLPGILLGFFAGVLTDRRKRKTMLVVTDIIRGCLVLAISFLSFNGTLQTWQVFFIAFSLSITTAFFEPAIQAIIPEIVEKEFLTKANGLSQMVSGICTVLGPLLGAVAVSIIGLTWVFLANSISYFISALLTCFIVTYKTHQNPEAPKNIRQDMHDGMNFIKKHQNIVLILKIIAIAHFFVGSLMVSLPFLAKALQGNGVKNLGYLEMTVGFGLIAGSIFMSMKKKASINERMLISLILAMGFCFIMIFTAQFFKIQTVYAYMVIMAATGACVSCASVFWQTLLQSYTPDYMTGRVFSISTLLGNTTLPVAYGVFGLLLNISSISILMAVCGLCLIILCCSLFFRTSFR